MRVGPIPTINKEFLLHTREWKQTAFLGLEHVRSRQNAGVHQKENAGVYQNASMHSPQSGHNDPQNDPTIKTENMIDETVNKNEAENEDGNDAENEDENGHEEPDEDEIE